MISFAEAFFIAVLLMSARCFAFDYADITGSTATGASITGYKKALLVDVTDFGADSSGEKDSYKAIQDALFYAVDNASDTIQLKVVVPPGEYRISKPLKIYSNTWLYMEGATIIRNFSTGFMFRNALQNPAGGYDGERNIIIEGGCFDGNTNSSSTPFSNVRLGHIRNLWIKGVEFRNNADGHLLEIGGAQNVTIEDCTFHGYIGYKEKEAIQLDTMNNSASFVHFEPFDDTACDNVVIRNNYFYDLMRGIGSHSATIGVYYTNVLIAGNTFENITSCAMIMQNYKNCLVEDNVMTNVGYGIDFKYMTPVEYYGYNPPVTGYNGIYDRIDDFANTIIRNNTISANVTGYASEPFGIQIYGRKLMGSSYPDYNYKVEGVKISDNSITTAGAAIIVNDSNGIQVKSNEIDFNSNGNYTASDLIIVKASSNSAVQNNVCRGGVQSAIYVGASKEITVKENTCTDPGASGVYVSLSASGVKVKSNTVKNALGNGIKVTKSASAEISENSVSGSALCGVAFSDGSGSAKKNTVSGGKSDGILADGEIEVTVSGNALRSNGGCGINAKNSAKVSVSGNKYEENSGGDATVSGGGNIAVAAAKKLTADEIYNEHIQLSWESVSEADSYSVCRRLYGSDEDFVQVAEVFNTSCVDLGLSSRTKYEYKVYGIKKAGDAACIGKGSKALGVRTKTAVSECMTTLPSVVKYSGREAEPDFDVYINGAVLVKNIDYTVKYSSNTGVGRANVTIVGCGQYCGLKELGFDIDFSSGESENAKKEDVSRCCAAENKTASGIVRCDIRADTPSLFGRSADQGTKIVVSGGRNYIQNGLEALKQQSVRFKTRSVRGSGVGKSYGLWI